MESDEIQRMVRPFYPGIVHAFETGWIDGMAAITIIRAVRKGERAAILHATIRESLRELCDACDLFLTMTEEAEGKGLDAMRLTLDEQSIAIRWARYDQVRGQINRSDSVRSVDSQKQQFLFGDHFDPSGIPSATVSYQIDDDEVVIGVPQGWMSRITLRRERVDSTEFIEELAAFDAPIRLADLPDPRTAEYIVTRQNRRDEIEQIGQQLRSELG